MNYIEYDPYFDHIDGDDTSYVFQLFPRVFNDSRGSFTEVFKENANEKNPAWLNNASWIKQINRSTSTPHVCRGMHAQNGKYCQSKLVECISGSIHDIIIDARPNSKTFGKTKVYHLNSQLANKLFIPTGFLHGFYSDYEMPDGTPIKENVFQYYIGGAAYSHENEFSVSIANVVDSLKNDIENYWLAADCIKLSEKDENGISIEKWFSDTMFNYKMTGNLWYK